MQSPWTYSIMVATVLIDIYLLYIFLQRKHRQCDLVGVKSPSEFLELWAAHARKQFENFAQQAQHLAGLAQKVTTDGVGPLQAGVKSAFSKAA
jgi:hypothetical protein